MADIYYVNSNGERINLDKPPYYLNRDTSLFSHKWEYVNADYASRIEAFKMEFVEREFNIGILASTDKVYRNAIKKINNVFDIDVRKTKCGRLYCGNEYLNCYIIECAQNRYDRRANVVLKPYKLVAENGNWVQEKYFTTISTNQNTGLDFMFDYPYDFAFSEDTNYINNTTVAGADFEMRMYGPIELPAVEIDGINYTANVDVEAGGYLEINSLKKTVLLYDSYGNIQNVFDLRNRNQNIFTKISPGKWYINRNDDFQVAIRLYMYKSEPEWWGD